MRVRLISGWGHAPPVLFPQSIDGMQFLQYTNLLKNKEKK